MCGEGPSHLKLKLFQILHGYANALVWVIVSATDMPRLITWVWCNIIYVIYGYGVSEVILVFSSFSTYLAG